MKFNTSKDGLHTMFRPYQAALLEHIWGLNSETRTGLTSSQAYTFLWQTSDRELRKSRASVIFSLNDMVDNGILEYEEESGKGGYHRVYYPKMDKEEFAKHVKKTITDKLAEVFPSSA